MADLGDFHSHHPRNFESFTYAYPVVSRRSGGVSLGVNLNLDKACNFDCPYCQVDRREKSRSPGLDLERLAAELEGLLSSVDPSGVCRLPIFATLPDSAKHLRDIALSGDGEPTLAPEFPTVCDMLSQMQSAYRQTQPTGYRLVLLTNATLLDREPVLRGLAALHRQDGEVWAKLDAGTQAYYDRINVSKVPLDKIESNLAGLGQRYPFRVQSFFCSWDGQFPSEEEVTAYLQRLSRLKEGGAQIREVQLYTLARKPADAVCGALPDTFMTLLRDRISGLGIPCRFYGTGATQ
jgi:wyosine [tRNA(Phe)-imidazoG37] synthetase (radical SAM superfamily)